MEDRAGIEIEPANFRNRNWKFGTKWEMMIFIGETLFGKRLFCVNAKKSQIISTQVLTVLS